MITLHHVTKSIGRQRVLTNVTFSVAQGEHVVLLGPNGAGKSTLLRTIAGLTPFDSGEIYVEDRIVRETKPAELPISMALPLFRHMKVRENLIYKLERLGFSNTEITQQIDEVLRLVMFDDALMERFPHQLSDGQRRRAILAMMLLRRSRQPVFLIDEPLQNMDAVGKRHAINEFLKLFEPLSATVLYVTHDHNEAIRIAGQFGRFIIMGETGTIAQIGTRRELINSPANDFVRQFFTEWADEEIALARELELEKEKGGV